LTSSSFFFSSRRRHTRSTRDWSSDVCSSDLVVQAQPGPGGHGPWRGHAFGFQQITEKLNLTSDQQTKVQPILDTAKPQIAAIHQEAMQKMKTDMDSTLSQSRTPHKAEQQKKHQPTHTDTRDHLNDHKP